MSIYTQIKQAVSVVETAKHYGLAVNRNGMARCPFHPDNTPSLKLNEDFFYCFGCQESGDVIDFTANLFHRRAVNWMTESGVVTYSNRGAAVSALRSAAYTYVVAALGSLATLMYYVMVYMGRRD